MTRLSIISLIGVLGSACGGKQYDFSGYATPQAIYDAGLAAFRNGDCNLADAAFNQVQRDFPARDGRQAEARFYLAECMMKRRQHLESARLFRRVTDEFPRHSLAPDALLRAGDAYMEMWRDPELDPNYGETALATFQELTQRFRGTPAAERARLRINVLNQWFAEKGFKSGVFYMRMRAYDSAIIYFKGIVADYPQSTYAPLSLLRLIEAYHRIGYQEEKAEMCQYLARYYPNAGQSAWCVAAEGAARSP